MSNKISLFSSNLLIILKKVKTNVRIDRLKKIQNQIVNSFYNF